MEALLFMLNSMAIVLMVFMGLRDDRRPPGVPHTSFFRMRDEPVKSAAPPHSVDTVVSEMGDRPSWAEWEQAGNRAP